MSESSLSTASKETGIGDVSHVAEGRGNRTSKQTQLEVSEGGALNRYINDNKNRFTMEDEGISDELKKFTTDMDHGDLNTKLLQHQGSLVRHDETYVSQMKNVNSFDPSGGIDSDIVCGIGWFRPKWLQSWATARVYLVLYSVIGTLSGAYYTYRIGTITTLEKRFAFKSKTSGAIMMIDELTPVFFGTLVGFFGGRSHRPRMFGLGMLFIVSACFISALPYFHYGAEKHLSLLSSRGNETGIQICEKSRILRDEECDTDSRPPSMTAVLTFMLASFLKGFGNLGYHSIGLSYMDDSAKKRNTILYLATAFTSRLLGPFLGFLMSSAFLKYYENPFEDPGYGPEDPRWIGAWWLGYCLNGIILFVATIPLALFPRRLPGHPKIEETSSKDKNRKNWIGSFAGFLAALKRLANNSLYGAIILHDIMTIFASAGYFIMLPKYMEHQFRLTASDANLFSGPPGVAAAMLSLSIGSYVVWKFKPKPKYLILGMIALEIVAAIGYSVMMVPKCEAIELSHYGINEEGFILDNSCNIDCSCSTKAFTPVCGSDGLTVHFSPCYAGCSQKMNESYSSCSCFSDSIGEESKTATTGFCVSETCWSQALAYIIMLPVLQFFAHFLRIPQSMLLLRCVGPKDKSVALGTFEALICILGFVPYILAFGAVVDTTCLVWEKSCEETGNCWFYDVQSFNYLLHGASVLFSAMAALSLILVYFLRGRLLDFYEEGDTDITAVDDSETEVFIKEREACKVTKF